MSDTHLADRPRLLAGLGVSRRARVRHDAVVLAVLATVLLGVSLATLMVGNRIIPLGDVVAVILGGEVPGAKFSVGELRLPRVIGGALSGAAFGLGGTIFQRLLRNVLASPDVIGISAGASAAAVIAIGFFGASGLVVVGSAVAGALAAAATIWACASRGGLSGMRFVLAGVAIAAALQAVIGFVLTRADVTQVQQAVVWMTGSLSRSLWDQVGPIAPVLIVLIAAALAAATSLPVLHLGDDTATSLGFRVPLRRGLLIVLAVLLIAAATALTGPIAFVAFLSGPIATRLVRREESNPAVAALLGAVVVLTADFIGQRLLGPVLPVGIVTGAIGAPYLLWLLMRGRTRA